jgi:hypothetical protein
MPRARLRRSRAAHEAVNRPSATTLPMAWAAPTARMESSTSSDKSDRPEAAVGRAATTPTATSVSAPRREVPLKSPTRSSRNALVHAPMGISVSIGCAGWPSHVPLSKSFTGPVAASLAIGLLTTLPATLSGRERSSAQVNDSS